MSYGRYAGSLLAAQLCRSAGISEHLIVTEVIGIKEKLSPPAEPLYSQEFVSWLWACAKVPKRPLPEPTSGSSTSTAGTMPPLSPHLTQQILQLLLLTQALPRHVKNSLLICLRSGVRRSQHSRPSTGVRGVMELTVILRLVVLPP